MVAVGGDTTTDMLTHGASVDAANPDHIWIMCGINDWFNHNSGNPIPPATTKANLLTYFAARKAARPNVRFHVIACPFQNGENWPFGVNPSDNLVTATFKAEQEAVALEPQAEWIDIQTPVTTKDAPFYNPTHLTSGVITQDGAHPTKPLGQHVYSLRVFNRTTFGI